MAIKKYSSYAEINKDLEILKLEREIYYKKMFLSFDRAKESIIPIRVFSLINNFYQKIFSGSLGTVLKMIVPYAINWFIKRKRGD